MSPTEVNGAVLIALAYLVGAIPFGFLIARWVGGIDIREAGSGNIGATNVARTVGRGWGLLTFALDAIKGGAPVSVAAHVFSLSLGWTLAVGLFSILGHVFPVYLRFRGGKGVATAAGVFFALTPHATAVALAAFGLTVALVRIVGLGSMVGAIALSGATLVLDRRPPVIAVATAVTVLVLVRHSGNIRRMRDRTPSSQEHAGGA